MKKIFRLKKNLIKKNLDIFFIIFLNQEIFFTVEILYLLLIFIHKTFIHSFKKTVTLI